MKVTLLAWSILAAAAFQLAPPVATALPDQGGSGVQSICSGCTGTFVMTPAGTSDVFQFANCTITITHTITNGTCVGTRPDCSHTQECIPTIDCTKSGNCGANSGASVTIAGVSTLITCGTPVPGLSVTCGSAQGCDFYASDGVTIQGPRSASAACTICN